MSVHFQRQIDRLKKLVLSLGAMAEDSVHQAIEAYEKRDVDLAKQVIANDGQVDLMEIDVEEECLHTLALHQPVAFDLRYVVAVLKINNDLERIADLAVNIAEQASSLSSQAKLEHVPFDLRAMNAKVSAMVKQCLDSLVQLDPNLAEQVRHTDDEVDLLYRQAYEQVIAQMRSEPQKLDQLLHVLSIARHLERIADHAVNISEDVIYMAKGEILRHNRPHPLAAEKQAVDPNQA